MGTTEGSLDAVVDRYVEGWALQKDTPGGSLFANIFIDGQFVTSGVCSHFRQDLKQAGIGEGCHAFRIALPAEYLDGRERLIDVRIADRSIPNSPRLFSLPKSQEEYLPLPQSAAAPTEQAAEQNHIARTIAAEFDAAFYLQKYPDIKEAGVDPLDHYITTGWREGRDPSPEFSTRYYLEQNPDVGEAGVHPFWHYIVAGRQEGRQATPPASPDQSVKEALLKDFDAAFYLQKYPDVREPGLDPLEHYLAAGWREGRDPCEAFSTAYYLNLNEDVRNAEVNPFWHYIVAGRAEGRKAQPPGGYKARHIRALQTVEEKCQTWTLPGTVRPKKKTVAALAAHLGKCAAGKNGRDFILSLSHDNYTQVTGGVQLCLKIEQTALEQQGAVYLQLHPFQPLPVLAREASAKKLLLNIVVDGKEFGVMPVAAIAQALAQVKDKGAAFRMVIHSLLGHSIEGVLLLHQAMHRPQAFFWLHDYFSLCPQVNLLRNEIDYCHVPAAASPACGICIYGEERRAHQEQMRRLFTSIPFTVVSPSRYALELWQEKTDLPYQKAVTHAHLRMKRRPSSSSRPGGGKTGSDAMKIAFLGHPVLHKGWHCFKELVREFAALPEYRFHHFGTQDTGDRAIRSHRVSVIDDGENAMIEALEQEKIDVVLLWSICPETFCFTAHEAIAAGAYLVTCASSGNVTRLIADADAGIVLESEAELKAFFASGRLRQAVLARRKRGGMRWNMTKSHMTSDLISLRKSA
jgi:hypothetical protein